MYGWPGRVRVGREQNRNGDEDGEGRLDNGHTPP